MHLGVLPLLLHAPTPVMRHGLVAMEGPNDFSASTRLRAEVEDPFAKLRLFAFPAAFAAAGIATYFGGTSLLAEVAGLRPASPDTYSNLAIDLGSLGAIGYFWRREAVANEQRMKRIARGAAIGSLRVQLLGGAQAGKVVKLVELRSGRGAADDLFDESSRRVVVVCAEAPALGASLAAAREASAQLCDADLLVVPLLAAGETVELPPPSLISGNADGSPADAAAVGHLALPQSVATWADVLEDERKTAASQDSAAASRGLTLILKKNGRVGTRRLGLPDWPAPVGDVSKRAAAGLDTRNI